MRQLRIRWQHRGRSAPGRVALVEEGLSVAEEVDTAEGRPDFVDHALIGRDWASLPWTAVASTAKEPSAA